MLLSGFKQLIDIDNDIEQLHQELSLLYKYRRSITTKKFTDSNRVHNFAPSQKAIAPNLASSTEQLYRRWEEEQYESLAALWSRYGLAVPEYKKLASKLTKAKHLINELLFQGENFELLLVPPTKDVNIHHPLISANSIVLGEGLKEKLDQTNTWKLYIVASDPLCNPINNASELASYKELMLHGHRMPGLDIREYAIFLATHEGVVDLASWSLVLRHIDSKTKLVPCVSRIGSTYQFEVDYCETLVGDNHFRPAMEVN